MRPRVFTFCLIGVWSGTLFLSAGCSDQREKTASYPRKPIKLVVPFSAGGGSDTFGRIVANEIDSQKLLAEKLVVINVPGAGGTIGSRRVKHARPDGYTILLLHEGMMTAQHAGAANYGPEAFEPIIGTGDVTQVVAVDAASPYSDLRSLMNAAEQEPDSVVFSANLGAPSHFAGLMLEQTLPGAEFRYTQTGGGAKRFAALRGGHVDVSAFSIAEYQQFRESGLRALALLGGQRRSDLPDLPTATELGFPVISQNMQFWWAPPGTPEPRVRRLADAIERAMQSEAVRSRLESMKIEPVVLRGKPLERELQNRDARLAAVAPRERVQLPDFALMSLITVLLTGAFAGWRARRRASSETAPAPAMASSSSSTWGRLFPIVLCSLVYVAALQSGIPGFVPSTFLYTLGCGLAIAWPAMRGGRSGSEGWAKAAPVVFSILSVSLFMSLGMDYLFTSVLVVDLP